MSMSDEKDTSQQAIVARFAALAGDARQGLPYPVFLTISALTPLINVDLLVRNNAGETLLVWRADDFYGPGWHVPGGIVRFKETINSRIQHVAGAEIGAKVECDEIPIAFNEIMAKHRDTRGHFISLLYRCRLCGEPAPRLKYNGQNAVHGQWKWHASCPPDLIPQHGMYRRHLDGA
jgi:colanic acid biosynthesis protein WcaH